MAEHRENSRRKYLTLEKFQEFKDNDFFHLQRDIARISGKVSVIIPLVCAILAFIIFLACRGI